MKNKLIVLFLSILSTPLFSQTIIYVDSEAIGLENGQNWNDAFTDIESAIASAPNNSEVWVKDNFNATPLSQSTDRTEQIEISKNLHFFGGFNTFVTSKEARGSNNKTNLSGKISDKDNRAFAFKITADSVTFDHFEFELYSGEGLSGVFSSVITVDSLASVSLNECDFERNENTTVLQAKTASKLFLNNVKLSNNNSEFSGSIIQRFGSAEVKINHSIINDNGSGFSNIINQLAPLGTSQDQLANWDENILLEIKNTNFVNNLGSIMYSYFGSIEIDSCNFFLTGNRSQTFTLISKGTGTFSLSNTNITGSHNGTVLYAYNYLDLTFDGVVIDNPSGSDCGLYFASVKKVNLINSDFNDLVGSQTVYFSSDGEVRLENSNFNGGNISSYLLYVNVPKLTIDDCTFQDNNAYQGNYFSSDTVVITNTTFKNIENYALFNTFYTKQLYIDNCVFQNLFLQDPLLYLADGQVYISNSLIDNISAPTDNPSRPLIYQINGSNGKIESVNNRIENIETTKLLGYTAGELIIFGNIIDTKKNTLPLFENRNTLSIYNSNIQMENTPLVLLDTTYVQDGRLLEFNLKNSIIYSDTAVLIKQKASESDLLISISNNITNQTLEGEDNLNNSLENFEAYFNPRDFDYIVDKGSLLNYILPSSDIEGNTRVMLGTIDIGAIESQEITVGLSGSSSSIKDELIIYPNPVTNSRFTVLAQKNNSVLEIRDLAGQLEAQYNLVEGENTISIANLNRGVYLAIKREGLKTTQNKIIY